MIPRDFKIANIYYYYHYYDFIRQRGVGALWWSTAW